MPLPSFLAASRLLSVVAAAVFAFPTSPQGEDVEQDARPEIVAEALFLADTLPPASRDLNLVLAVERGDRDALTTSPVLQLAVPFGDRVGFTVDLGFPVSGGIESPGASLKFLLRDAARAVTGFSASLDLYGSLRREVDTEVAFGVGALHPLGRIVLRATALAATGVSGWTPRLHAGVSAALALSSRWIALAEVMADTSLDGTVVSAGPAVKVALGESLALMTGALFEVGGPAMPVFTFQVTQSW